MSELGLYEEKKLVGEGTGTSELICKTIYAWEEAVSPHLAAERESGIVRDSVVLETLQKCFRNALGGTADNERPQVLCVVETAGGLASPGPSGSLQCDLYRPFRIPAILVGDGRLGGVSGTISAYESLKLRGFDVVAVVLDDHGLNEFPLMSYLRNKVPVLVLPPVPKDPSNDLMEWFEDSHGIFSNLKEILLSAYSERIKKLHDMPRKAQGIFWWPFTQHKLVPEGGITVIDSRCGENFAVFKSQKELITPLFDACASWWTQGPDATLQDRFVIPLAVFDSFIGDSKLWDDKLVHQISSLPAVQRVIALGTLCAFELEAEGNNAGYGSLYARILLQNLREDGIYVRPLGNVIYLMSGPCTSPETCSQLLIKLYGRLEEFSGNKKRKPYNLVRAFRFRF